ncbi:dihydrofolate reductase [Paenibacillus protaetiae]|uniref:Dihydrofolate reductase n=2 Tax=Paenibacillus protaetiae TaxID=2509456 RepID=A0A4P6EY99_9BACL|nr:dihydrofolate reductase [Paenibacillus protaetiae]
MIAAIDQHNAIGVENGLPWRLPADMAYFVRMTTGKPVLMGRKTFESFGSKPLRNRRNVILTRQDGVVYEGAETVSSIEQALQLMHADEEWMVIGGAEIYELFMPYADKLLLTEIATAVERADAFFPEVKSSEWKLAGSEQGIQDEKNPYVYFFQTYIRL